MNAPATANAPRTISSGLLVQWSVILATVGGIAYTGSQLTAVPPLLHPTKVMVWWASVGPVTGAVTILWATVLATGAYWLALFTFAVITSVRGRTAWLLKSRLPGTQHLLRSVAGASVLGVTLVAASSCGAAGSTGGASGRAPVPPVLVPVAGMPDAPVTTVPPEPEAPATTVPATTSPQPLAPAAVAPSVQPPAIRDLEGATEWTVRRGEDLWSITESVLADRLGRQPTDTEIAPLWLRVIDANRGTLPDPGNPNLIFAGEVVAVPW